MHRRPALAVLATTFALGSLALAGPVLAGTQDYAYTCPPLEAATITVTGTAPATVQPNAGFSVTDGVISGSVELGQFAAFVSDGATADVTAAVVVGTEGDANPDGSVSVTITLSKSGTVASFSQALPPVALTAGPDVAAGVGIAPGTATVTMSGGAGATCTRTGAEGPFATLDIAGEPVAPAATTSTTAATGPAATRTGGTGGGAVLADSGAEGGPLLLVGGGGLAVALAASRVARPGRRARP